MHGPAFSTRPAECWLSVAWPPSASSSRSAARPASRPHLLTCSSPARAVSPYLSVVFDSASSPWRLICPRFGPGSCDVAPLRFSSTFFPAHLDPLLPSCGMSCFFGDPSLPQGRSLGAGHGDQGRVPGVLVATELSVTPLFRRAETGNACMYTCSPHVHVHTNIPAHATYFRKCEFMPIHLILTRPHRVLS